MNFDIKTEQLADGAYVISLAGEVDLYTAPEFKQQLLDVIGKGGKQVVVDFTDTTFIDSTTLGVLVGGVKRLRTNDGQLSLVCSDRNITKIFEITGLDRVFTIYPTREEAVAYDRRQGFKQVTIEQVVRDQIELASGRMPPNLVRGADADAVAAYVAGVAGKPGAAAAGGGGKQPTSGKDIFTANCGSCHTLADAGTSGKVGPNLDQLKPALARVVKQVTNGGAIMPAFKGKLSEAQIKAVAKYISSVAGKH